MSVPAPERPVQLFMSLPVFLLIKAHFLSTLFYSLYPFLIFQKDHGTNPWGLSRNAMTAKTCLFLRQNAVRPYPCLCHYFYIYEHFSLCSYPSRPISFAHVWKGVWNRPMRADYKNMLNNDPCLFPTPFAQITAHLLYHHFFSHILKTTWVFTPKPKAFMNMSKVRRGHDECLYLTTWSAHAYFENRGRCWCVSHFRCVPSGSI